MKAKYDIDVQITGQDGNVFNLISLCTLAMKRNGVEKSEIEEFRKECMSGDYDNALQTMMKWVNVH